MKHDSELLTYDSVEAFEQIESSKLHSLITENLGLLSSQELYATFHEQAPPYFWIQDQKPFMCVIQPEYSFVDTIITFMQHPAERMPLIHDEVLKVQALSLATLGELTQHGIGSTQHWMIFFSAVGVFIQQVECKKVVLK